MSTKPEARCHYALVKNCIIAALEQGVEVVAGTAEEEKDVVGAEHAVPAVRAIPRLHCKLAAMPETIIARREPRSKLPHYAIANSTSSWLWETKPGKWLDTTW